MSDADAQLRALFAQDDPPRRDPAFSARVMADVLRRRLWRDLGQLGVASLLGALGLWAAWPTLHSAWGAMAQGLSPTIGALTLAACIGVMLSGRAASLLGLES